MRKSFYASIILALSILLSLPTAGLAATSILSVGVQNQPISDIVLTETIPDTFETNTYFKVSLPQGIKFSELPIVEVDKGDLLIDSVVTDDDINGKSYLRFDIKSSSSKESVIKISGIKVSVNRSVPTGPVFAEISGTAINQNEDSFPVAKNLNSD